jgi:hypothetical protein
MAVYEDQRQNLLVPETEVENGKDQETFHEVVSQAISLFRNAVGTTSIITMNDVAQYEQYNYNDAAWNRLGKSAYKDRIEMVRDSINTYIPEMITEAREQERKFKQTIDKAVQSGWISRESGDKWHERLADPNVKHWDKITFLKNEFPTYVKNWEKLNDNLQKFKGEKEQAGIPEQEAKKIPAIAKLNSDEFLKAKYPKKRAMLDEAFAALSVWKKNGEGTDVKTLHAEAEQELSALVKAKIISPELKAKLLKSVFKSNTKDIKNFLSGKGPQPLSELKDGWTDARNRFDALDKQVRAEKAVSRNFRYVHLNVFLGMPHGQKLAYLKQAAEHLEEFKKEPDEFLRIRHEFETDDWKSAEYIIEKAKQKEWTPEQKKKLDSFEGYLRKNRDDLGSKEEETPPTREQLEGKLDSMMSLVPPQFKELYLMSLNRGYNHFWTLSTLLYNREWCYMRGYLNEKREKHMMRNTKHETQRRMREGHEKDQHIANDISSGENVDQSAIRNQKGLNKAQFLLTSEQSKNVLFERIERDGNQRDFWYNTSIIDNDIPIDKHKDLVRLNRDFKSLLRTLDQRGMQVQSDASIGYKKTESLREEISASRGIDTPTKD